MDYLERANLAEYLMIACVYHLDVTMPKEKNMNKILTRVKLFGLTLLHAHD
jgi:hypothetical protein